MSVTSKDQNIRKSGPKIRSGNLLLPCGFVTPIGMEAALLALLEINGG